MMILKPASRAAAISFAAIALAAFFAFLFSRHFKVDYPVVGKVYGAYSVFEGQAEAMSGIPYLRCGAGSHEIRFLELEGDSRTDPVRVRTQKNSGESASFEKNVFFTEILKPLSLSEETLLKSEKPVTFTAAAIVYDDGTKVRADIGQIVFYPEESRGAQPFEWFEENYEKGGAVTYRFRVRREVVIDSITGIPDSAHYKLSVNGRELNALKGKTLERGGKLEFSMQPESRFAVYEPAVRVTGKTKEGKPFTQILSDFDGDLTWSGEGVSFGEARSYLKERAKESGVKLWNR